jgi:hypothetical protein
MKSFRAMLVMVATAFPIPLVAQQQPAPAAGHAPGAGMHAMAAHMHAMDSLGARLDTAVARMNRATGDARTAAMQDVLRELVASHKEMHAHMAGMASHHAMGDSAGMQHQMPRPMPGAARPDSTMTPRRCSTMAGLPDRGAAAVTIAPEPPDDAPA